MKKPYRNLLDSRKQYYDMWTCPFCEMCLHAPVLGTVKHHIEGPVYAATTPFIQLTVLLRHIQQPELAQHFNDQQLNNRTKLNA